MATLLVILPIDRLMSFGELTLETGCVKPDLSIERNNVVTGGGRIAERLPSMSLRRAEKGMQAASAERPIHDLGPRMPGFLGFAAGFVFRERRSPICASSGHVECQDYIVGFHVARRRADRTP